MTTTQNITAPRTVARNATRAIAAIRENAPTCTVHLTSGNFGGERVDPAEAWDTLNRKRSAKLTDNGDGTWTIQVHDNYWFELSA